MSEKMVLRIDKYIAADGDVMENALGDVMECTVLETVPEPAPEAGWTLPPPLPLGAKEWRPQTTSELNEAIQQSNEGDHIVLQRGTQYDLSIRMLTVVLKSRQVLRASDEPHLPPPILYSDTDIIRQIRTPANGVSVYHIEFQGPEHIYTPRGSGVSILEGNDWYFEGCIFWRLGIGVNLTGNSRKQDMVFRRCAFLDSVQLKQSNTGEWGWLHSHGLFAKCVDSLWLEECIFDGNGWREGVGERWGQNHNCYIQGELGSECTDVRVINCVTTRAANFGLMCRVATQVQGNFSAYNPSGISAGTEKESRLQPCVFKGNWNVHGVNVIGSNGVPTLSWAFLIGDVFNPLIEVNFAWNADGINGYGMNLRNRVGQATLIGNVTHNHGDGYRQKLTEYAEIYYINNHFGATEGQKRIVNNGGPIIPISESAPFPIRNANYTLADYDPKFIEEVRKQRKGNWREKYMAQNVNAAFLAEGYGA